MAGYTLLDDAPVGKTGGGYTLLEDAPLTASNALAQLAEQSKKPVDWTNRNNALAGAFRGAGSIGATVMRALPSFLGGDNSQENDARRKSMDDALQSLGADPDSLAYKGFKLGAEIAGTAGVGGALGNTVRAISNAPKAVALANALSSGGMVTGARPLVGPATLGPVANMATRIVGGAVTGGASAGMVNPEDAGFGAAVGGAIPPFVKGANALGGAIKNAVLGDGVAPEVAALANKAKALGISIPADRIVNKAPLNALASSLNYIPFSGRSATENAMNEGLNKALSKTFGQDSSNITMALRKANDVLGGKFEQTLSQNGVKFDQQLLQDLASVGNKAESELGADALKPITTKISELIEKGQSGVIDGQAAYNIKRDLDRIGGSNNPNAFHAIELKQKLMDALNRSLGPAKASEFAQTRQHYGNMLDLEKLAKNGAEGDISVARLANMRNINNPQMQELADIAAQFVKPREGAHGAAQRVYGAGGAGLAALGAAAGVPGGAAAALGAAGLLAGGRAANSTLKSEALAKMLLKPRDIGAIEPLGLLTQTAIRAAPQLHQP